MKICSKEGGLFVTQVGIQFPAADVPIEVDDETAKVILRNPTFYEYKGKKKVEETKKHIEPIGKVSILKQGESFAEVKYDRGGE